MNKVYDEFVLFSQFKNEDISEFWHLRKIYFHKSQYSLHFINIDIIDFILNLFCFDFETFVYI